MMMAKRTRDGYLDTFDPPSLPTAIVFPDMPQRLAMGSQDPQLNSVLGEPVEPPDLYRDQIYPRPFIEARPFTDTQPSSPLTEAQPDTEARPLIQAQPLIHALDSMNTDIIRKRKPSPVHIAMEKRRRERIRESCDEMRTLLPYINGRRTDMASILETCVDYLAIVNNILPDTVLQKITDILTANTDQTSPVRKTRTSRTNQKRSAPTTPLYINTSPILPAMTPPPTPNDTPTMIPPASTIVTTISGIRMAKTFAPTKRSERELIKQEVQTPIMDSLLDNEGVERSPDLSPDQHGNVLMNKNHPNNPPYHGPGFVQTTHSNNYYLSPLLPPQATQYGAPWDTSWLPYQQMPLLYNNDPRGTTMFSPAIMNTYANTYPNTPLANPPLQNHQSIQPVMCMKNRYSDHSLQSSVSTPLINIPLSDTTTLSHSRTKISPKISPKVFQPRTLFSQKHAPKQLQHTVNRHDLKLEQEPPISLQSPDTQVRYNKSMKPSPPECPEDRNADNFIDLTKQDTEYTNMDQKPSVGNNVMPYFTSDPERLYVNPNNVLDCH